MGDNGIYRGASYKFEYGNGSVEDPFVDNSDNLSSNLYRVKAGNVGLATDVRTANQLQEVSQKFSTGAKTIEMSAIQSNILEAIPKQHFEEIRRLKDLVGADLTFHGPLIEPTGISQQGWDESARKQAERQLSEAVSRSQQLNPKGNTIVTLHTSNGLLAPSIRMNLPDPEDPKKKKEQITNIAVIDESTGSIGYLPKKFISENKITGQTVSPEKEGLERLNRDSWEGKVVPIENQTMKAIEVIESGLGGLDISSQQKEEEIKKVYKLYSSDRKRYEQIRNDLISSPGTNITGEILDRNIGKIAYGEDLARSSYRELQDLFSHAWEAAERQGKEGEEQLAKLKEYQKDSAKNLQEWEKNPLKVKEFAEEVAKGIGICREITPRLYRPVEEFAIEKASETFGNVAFNAYSQYGNNSPIISIENPPVGMGLSRADEIAKLVKATRKHFVDRVMNEKNISKEEATAQANKLIGVTWDVGHINMIRKYGYEDSDLIKETAQVKDFVKHIHLSDNFGLEHTELPMGMGNVPLKEHLAELGEKAAKAKQIIETGDWYQHFKTPPLSEVLHALGSPIYPMHMQPYWNQASGMNGVPGYFSGYGYNPEQHHSMYGAGFSGLPAELGGSAPGRAGSRLSGTPME